MGVEGVVNALHHIPVGEVWPVDEILKRKELIEKEGLDWEVVESLPVSEAIKQGIPLRETHIANYKESLRNLSISGIKTVVYNFMPVLDWIRTDLHFILPGGGESMLFDFPTFVAFDVYLLQRPGAVNDYGPGMLEKAKEVFSNMSETEKETLAHNIIVVPQGFINGLNYNSVEDYKKTFL